MKTASVDIKINGKSEKVEEGASLKTILLSKNVNPNIVACELNLKVIRRKDLDITFIHDGDTLEIIRMVGGG